MTPTTKKALALVVALGAVAAACGSDDDTSSEPAATDGETVTTDEASETTDEATDGEAVCPTNLVIQKDWWPETEHGGTYQLIGAGGESDPSLFTYSGPIDPAYAVGGIETVEIRSGGDAIEFQPVSAVMMTDRDITLGYVNTDDAIQSSPTVEVTAVATTLEINPQMIMWDPEQLEIDVANPETILDSGARVLHFSEATYIDWLISKGFMDEGQSDPNYGGAPDQWISDGGNFIQQGFATNEVFKYENLIEWKDGAPAPVEYAIIHELGWQPYPAAYSVLTERLDELSPCLELLVPKLQQAWVDYLNDPEPIGDVVIEVTEAYNNYWTLTPELNARAFELFESDGYGGNGSDDTYGNFDAERIQTLFDDFGVILENRGITLPEGFTAESVYTNEFIDESIGR
ncbi:MAG TPA: hypothetical protein VLN74_02540 [Ilumatobacteraceae bacterium]|nr:hypothetical protein [Ilumatobacteraceae bacterium]